MNEPIYNKRTMNKELLFLGLEVQAQNIVVAFVSHRTQIETARTWALDRGAFQRPCRLRHDFTL
jgi:hypothetical protein